MKTTAFTGIAIAATLAAIIALPALAQGGMGYGQGRGMALANQSAPATGQGQMGMRGGRGMGAGMHGGQGGMGQGMSMRGTGPRGAGLMTPDERTAFQQKMHQVKTVDECLKVQGEQRAAMAARAAERGVTLPEPRQNACENMKARGWIK